MKFLCTEKSTFRTIFSLHKPQGECHCYKKSRLVACEQERVSESKRLQEKDEEGKWGEGEKERRGERHKMEIRLLIRWGNDYGEEQVQEFLGQTAGQISVRSLRRRCGTS